MGHVIHKVKFGVKVKVIAPKHAYFGNLWNPCAISFKMTPNLFKSPKWLRRYCDLKYGRYPAPFFAKTPIFEKAYLQNYSSISIKLKILAFLYELYKQTKFHANRRFLVKKLKKFWVIWDGMTHS